MFSQRLASSSRSFTRAFAAAASHAPPKKIHGTTGKYAMATYTAASKAGSLEKVEAELLSVREILNKNAAFANFLTNPTIPRHEKVSQIETIFDKKFTDITRNLFVTLSANGRASDADKVIASYVELMQASRGNVEVTIISAEPLKKKQVETIQGSLASFIGNAKQVDVKLQVTPSILGGLQILVGDRFLDLSVASRVTELIKTLNSNA